MNRKRTIETIATKLSPEYSKKLNDQNYLENILPTAELDHLIIERYSKMLNQILLILEDLKILEDKLIELNLGSAKSTLFDVINVIGTEDIPQDVKQLLISSLHSIATKMHQLMSRAEVSIPIPMDKTSSLIVMHDLGKHLLKGISTSQLFISMHLRKLEALEVGETLIMQDYAKPYLDFALLELEDSMVMFINYYSIMTKLHFGIDVSTQEFINSLPSGVDIVFETKGNKLPELRPGSYTAIRTVALNAIQYVVKHLEILEDGSIEIEVENVEELDKLVEFVAEVQPDIATADEIYEDPNQVIIRIINTAETEDAELIL